MISLEELEWYNMERYLKAEIIKLHSLSIWWLIIAGAILPGTITYLTLFNQDNVSWLSFTHMCLLTFNIQSLLTFSAFATYIWAREYEENTMEVVLCYPYPRFVMIFMKLVILFFVILITGVMFFVATLIAGRMLFDSMMPMEIIGKLVVALLNTGMMHFLLVPMYLCIAVITKTSISGLVFGIVNMCICMALSTTGFVQYIPQCIPYVMGDNLLGVKSMTVDNDLAVYYTLLIGIFIIFTFISKKLERKF